MAYRPSSELLSSLSPRTTSGYRPSSDLLKSFIPDEDKISKEEAGKQRFREMTDISHSADPLGIISSALYGLGKGGSNIAKTFNPNAPSMPDIRIGHPSKIAEIGGQYLPFGLAGGSSLGGSTAAAGAFGAMQHEPGQGLIDNTLHVPEKYRRATSAVEDALLNAVTHGVFAGAKKLFFNQKPPEPKINFEHQSTFAPGESELTNQPFTPPKFLQENQPSSLSEKISQELLGNIAGKRSLEDSGKQVAAQLSHTYESVHGAHRQRYDAIFEHPTEYENVFTGEPFKVKEMRVDNGDYIKRFNDVEFKDKNLEALHKEVMSNPTIENLHKLQSELGSEIGTLQRQKSKDLLDDEGKNKLATYAKARKTAQEDIRLGIGEVDPKLRDAYDEVSQSYKENVRAYHVNDTLREIVTGKLKNPTINQLVSIFRNPEPYMDKIISHLPQDAKDRILHIGSGKGYEQNTPKDLLDARRALERKGLSSYINPHYEQAFKNIKSNIDIEKETANVAERNKKLIESLKKEYERAEQARIAAAKSREKIRKLADKSATKELNERKKELQAQYNEQIKRNEQSSLRNSKIMRTIIGGTLGASLVHGFGIKPEDIIGGYMGKTALDLTKHLKKR